MVKAFAELAGAAGAVVDGDAPARGDPKADVAGVALVRNGFLDLFSFTSRSFFAGFSPVSVIVWCCVSFVLTIMMFT